MKKSIISAALMASVLGGFAQPQLSKDNIDEVIKAMTIEEKVTLCIGGANASIVDGIASGQVSEVPGAAGKTNAIERLGIPSVLLADGPAGLRIDPTRKGEDRTYYCTAFPVGTLLASSWDVELVRKATAAMGNEVREYGVDVILAPGANIHRNPLCGRNFEYFSEDPVLSGNIAAAYINGIQDNGVGACLKHYAVNNQETNRVENNAIVGTRALREIYLKNFEIAIKKSSPWTIMSSYNRLNGPYTQQSHDLLTKVLRQDWGYQGMVMTDWGRKPDTWKSVLAGNNLYEPGTKSEKEWLLAAVKDGRLTEQDLDKCVWNILNMIVKTPRFAGYKYSSNPDLTAHAQVARQTAAESMVLLRNERRTLPLKGNEKVALYGLGSIDFIPGGTGSGSVNKAYTRQLDESLAKAGFTLDANLTDFYRKYVALDEATAKINDRKKSFSAQILAEPELKKVAIQKQADSNDAAIIVIRRNAGEGSDRSQKGVFELSDTEKTLIKNVAEAYHTRDKRVIVILNIDGAIETASWKQLADAILLPWTPGQEGTEAIADVLTGKTNPSGRLPMTFPVNFFDHLSSRNFPLNDDEKEQELDYWSVVAGVMNLPMPEKKVKDVDSTEYKEGIWVGYRYFDTIGKEVSYPFGYGLSYTTFNYSKPQIRKTATGMSASVTVTNTGRVAGKEVVEVYVAAPKGRLEKPSKELKAFAKTRMLKPGESQTMTFNLSAYELASFNQDANQWETALGDYRVLFGASVADIKAQASLRWATLQTQPVSDAFQTVKLEEYKIR